MNKTNVYMGWDSRETKAYDVALHSIKSRTAKDVRVIPLQLDYLKELGFLDRPIEKRDGKMWCPISQAPVATEFAISRFTVPFFQKDGWALFVDCDIICLSDIKELFSLADDRYAVMVVKHDHASGVATKMDGQTQTYYARKNWSSVILWNCAHPCNRLITPQWLNTWPGRDLHAFGWLKDEEIGTLPRKWNQLVGVNCDVENVEMSGILHYTLGGPWLPGWTPDGLDDIWLKEAAKSGL